MDTRYPFLAPHVADLPMLLYKSKNVSGTPESYIDWGKFLTGEFQLSPQQMASEYQQAGNQLSLRARDTWNMQGNIVNALENTPYDQRTSQQQTHLKNLYRTMGRADLAQQLDDIETMEELKAQMEYEEDRRKRQWDDFVRNFQKGK